MYAQQMRLQPIDKVLPEAVLKSAPLPYKPMTTEEKNILQINQDSPLYKRIRMEHVQTYMNDLQYFAPIGQNNTNHRKGESTFNRERRLERERQERIRRRTNKNGKYQWWRR